MSELGEGSAVTTIEDVVAETGALKISVRDICTGKRVPGATISVGINTQTGDDQGEASFSDLSVGIIHVSVKIHNEDLDYSTFVVHYPRILRSYEAKSYSSDIATITKNDESSLEILLEIYMLVGDIVFHRKHIDPKGDDKYGHWWTVVDENTSFGWWPKYPLGSIENRFTEPPKPPKSLPSDASRPQKIQYMFKKAIYQAQSKMYALKESAPAQTVRGVEGELNAKFFGGIVNNEMKIYADPHAISHDSGDELYHPIRDDCFTTENVKECIVHFALTYSGGWSWLLEAGNHCHTFQKKLMKHCKLEKVKVLK